MKASMKEKKRTHLHANDHRKSFIDHEMRICTWILELYLDKIFQSRWSM